MVELLLVLVLGVIHLYNIHPIACTGAGDGRAPTGAGSGGHPPLSFILSPVQEPGMVELLLVLVLGVTATRAGVIHLYHSSYCLYRSRGW
jgi:hypothetical protein